MKKLALLCVLLVWSLFFPFAQAFGQTSEGNFQTSEIRANATVERDHRTYTQSTVIELLVSFSCILTGVDPVNPETPCVGVDPVSRQLGYTKPHSGGLTGIFGGMIAGMYNIPISSHDYVAYSASKFGVVQNTYAQEQGVGFDALSPVISVWVAFRNVVFIFFVILFILIGIGIMFRLQVDQRAVMSVQNQLPKIVLVIILVVLSYAIAGFLIDLMFVLMYFIFSLFSSIEGVRLDSSILQSSNPFGALGGVGGLGSITADASGSVGDIISSIFDGTAGRVIASLLVGIISGVVGGLALGPWGLLAGLAGIGAGAFFGGEVLGLLGSVVAFVIFGAAIVIALFRIWFLLLKAFISVLIGATIAPIWIAASLIPATPFPLGSWFRFMIGNLLMFPATLTMFLFAYVFLQLFKVGPDKTISFPFVGNPRDVDTFGALIAFGIILMTPTVIEKVKDAIGTPTGDITTAIAGTLAGGKNVAGGLIGGAAKPYWGQYRDGTRKPLTRMIQGGLQRGFGEGLGKRLSSILPGKNED